jgi:hypothetical protein
MHQTIHLTDILYSYKFFQSYYSTLSAGNDLFFLVLSYKLTNQDHIYHYIRFQSWLAVTFFPLIIFVILQF